MEGDNLFLVQPQVCECVRALTCTVCVFMQIFLTDLMHRDVDKQMLGFIHIFNITDFIFTGIYTLQIFDGVKIKY